MTHRARSILATLGVLACLGLATAVPADASIGRDDVNTTYRCIQAPCPGAPIPTP